MVVSSYCTFSHGGNEAASGWQMSCSSVELMCVCAFVCLTQTLCAKSGWWVRLSMQTEIGQKANSSSVIVSMCVCMPKANSSYYQSFKVHEPIFQSEYVGVLLVCVCVGGRGALEGSIPNRTDNVQKMNKEIFIIKSCFQFFCLF